MVRKPFTTGASTDFMARFRERVALLLDRYEGSYPVREVLERNLRGYLRRAYAPPPELLKAADLDCLLDYERRWREVGAP